MKGQRTICENLKAQAPCVHEIGVELNRIQDELNPRKPSKDEIQAAAGRPLPDIIAPGLKVLFCGINPSLYSAAVGHHFARPGNRFWPVLYKADFTNRQIAPFEGKELLKSGYGMTNIVSRATARADELSKAELIAAVASLEKKVSCYRPQALAVLGIGAYRSAFKQRSAVIGLQQERMGACRLWVLPNPSGLNAGYQLEDLTRLYRALRMAITD